MKKELLITLNEEFTKLKQTLKFNVTLDELDDEGNEQEIPVRKYYKVFNEEQTEKLIEELGVK